MTEGFDPTMTPAQPHVIPAGELLTQPLRYETYYYPLQHIDWQRIEYIKLVWNFHRGMAWVSAIDIATHRLTISAIKIIPRRDDTNFNDGMRIICHFFRVGVEERYKTTEYY
jgi:hypothetical protein